MNEEQTHYGGIAAGDETLDEVAFIVRRVAKALSMPTKNIELATFLPVAPDKYELVTRKNPQGVFIDDEIANNIDSDAFACYAGLPLK